MRTLLAPAIILAAAAALAACKPAAPPAKEYAYPAWGFKAAFPAAPTETNQPGPPDGSAPNADLVEAIGGGRDFAVWAADVSRTGMSLDELGKSAAEHVSQGFSATAGVPAYAATSEGVMGREYQMTKGGQWQATMRVFLVGGRFYEVIGKSALGRDDPALKNFLFSFHATGAAAAATNGAW